MANATCLFSRNTHSQTDRQTDNVAEMKPSQQNRQRDFSNPSRQWFFFFSFFLSQCTLFVKVKQDFFSSFSSSSYSPLPFPLIPQRQNNSRISRKISR